MPHTHTHTCQNCIDYVARHHAREYMGLCMAEADGKAIDWAAWAAEWLEIEGLPACTH